MNLARSTAYKEPKQEVSDEDLKIMENKSIITTTKEFTSV
jgi:hypothetical protein